MNYSWSNTRPLTQSPCFFCPSTMTTNLTWLTRCSRLKPRWTRLASFVVCGVCGVFSFSHTQAKQHGSKIPNHCLRPKNNRSNHWSIGSPPIRTPEIINLFCSQPLQSMTNCTCESVIPWATGCLPKKHSYQVKCWLLSQCIRSSLWRPESSGIQI